MENLILQIILDKVHMHIVHMNGSKQFISVSQASTCWNFWYASGACTEHLSMRLTQTQETPL